MSNSALSVGRAVLESAASASKDLTPMQLLKLVYIAHGWSLGLRDSHLISDRVEAWRYGPVIPILYHKIKGFRDHAIPRDALSEYEEISSDDSLFVKDVYSLYDEKDGITLSRLTHQEGTPWDQVYEAGCSHTIPNDLIDEHYSRLAV